MGTSRAILKAKRGARYPSGGHERLQRNALTVDARGTNSGRGSKPHRAPIDLGLSVAFTTQQTFENTEKERKPAHFHTTKY